MIRLILPAYNEESTLPPLLDSVNEALAPEEYLVYVINDGSLDSTADVARDYSARMPLRLIEHERNLGLAEGMRTGFRAALADSHDSDIIVTMDSDNTHPPSLIPLMQKKLDEGMKLVIASRYVPGGKVFGLSLSRRVLSFGASILFRVFLPIAGVKDYTCGFRAYRAGLLREMMETYGDDFISEKGFSCMVDMLLKIRASGRARGAVAELPLVLRYDRKVGQSKMKVGRTVIDTLRLIVIRRWKA